MSSVDRNLVLAHVQSNPGRSTQEIRDALKCRKAALIDALAQAEREGLVRHETGTGKGSPKCWYAVERWNGNEKTVERGNGNAKTPAFTSFDSMMDMFFTDVAEDEAVERAALEQQKAVEPVPAPAPVPEPVPAPEPEPSFWPSSDEHLLADMLMNAEEITSSQRTYFSEHRSRIEDLMQRKRQQMSGERN